jgi:hypothetical protein
VNDGPRVLFDEAHHNHHRARTTYRPFSDLLESDGYRVTRGTGRLTAAALANTDVLVIANAMGTNERNDDPAFTPDEVRAVERWVRDGGALLLITDHYPFAEASETLEAAFGVVNRGVVEDSTRYDRAFEPTHVVYARADGGLAAHPITRGRDTSEALDRVLSFTGQGLSGPPGSVAFLAAGPEALARPPQPVVERRGGDVRVLVAYGDPVRAAGAAQGLALEHGKGRVVVIGDGAMLTAQLHRFDGRPIGMNVQGYDNRQLALNIMHWLTRLL